MSVDPRSGVLSLPFTSRAPAVARDHVRVLGARWPPDLLDVVLLVVSEAVTNAVRYGNGDVELAVLVGPDAIRVEVSDANPQPPHKPRSATGLDDGGRGLHLIESLTSTWGIRPRAGRPGKTVWLELPAPV